MEGKKKMSQRNVIQRDIITLFFLSWGMQEERLSLFGNLSYQLFDLVILPLGTHFKDRREKHTNAICAK